MWCENLFAHGRVERRLAPVRAALGVIVITGMVAATSTGAQTNTAQPVSTPNAGQDTRTYADVYRFNGRPFVRDPWIWSYTKEFAEANRLPLEGVDPELKGFFAVAFRVSPEVSVSCGFGGNPASCMPSYSCQLDVYMPSDVPLPWVSPSIRRDIVMLRGTSGGIIDPSRNRVRFEQRYPNPLHPLYGRTGGELVMTSEAGPSGFVTVRHFDRDYAPGVMLIGYAACPLTRGPQADVELRAFTREAWVSVGNNDLRFIVRNNAHIFSGVIPKSFWDRADAVYKRDTAPAEAALDRVTRDAVERLRPPAQQPQAVPAAPAR